MTIVTTPHDPTIDVALYALMERLEVAVARYEANHWNPTASDRSRVWCSQEIVLARHRLSQYLTNHPDTPGAIAARRLLHPR